MVFTNAPQVCYMRARKTLIFFHHSFVLMNSTFIMATDISLLLTVLIEYFLLKWNPTLVKILSNGEKGRDETKFKTEKTEEVNAMDWTVFPPNFMCSSLYPVWWYWEMGLWEVIRVKWAHEGMILKMGLSFPGDANSKELECQCRKHKRLGSTPGPGRSPGEGHGNLLWYSCLENPMGSRAWLARVHGGHKELDMTEVTEHMPKKRKREAYVCHMRKQWEGSHL